MTQFHRGDLSFVREETWTPVVDGRATAVVTGADPWRARRPERRRGARPGDTGDGSRMAFKATVEVRVPLVGGKIENFIGIQLVDLLIAEQRFTTVWITENA